jgi:hypothetical protein
LLYYISKRYLLIDFENINKIDLSHIDDDLQVMVFVGCSQKCVSFDLIQGTQRLGTRLEWIKVDGAAKNALDFHIAYYLGYRFTQSPTAECFVLSNDTGFDPLIQHLEKRKLHCKRISSVDELKAKPSPTPKPKPPLPPTPLTPLKTPAVVKPLVKPTLPTPPQTSPQVSPSTPYNQVVDALKQSAKNRPKTRAALEHHVSDLCKKKLPEAEVKQLVSRLISKGLVVMAGESKITYHFPQKGTAPVVSGAA